jgi:hypothetical protein
VEGQIAPMKILKQYLEFPIMFTQLGRSEEPHNLIFNEAEHFTWLFCGSFSTYINKLCHQKFMQHFCTKKGELPTSFKLSLSSIKLGIKHLWMKGIRNCQKMLRSSSKER